MCDDMGMLSARCLLRERPVNVWFHVLLLLLYEPTIENISSDLCVESDLVWW